MDEEQASYIKMFN